MRKRTGKVRAEGPEYFAAGIALRGKGGTTCLLEAGFDRGKKESIGQQAPRLWILDSTLSQANRLEQDVASVINRRAGSDYVVVNVPAGTPATRHLELLSRFRCPERVEIASSPEFLRESVREVILKSIGNIWSEKMRGAGGAGAGFEGLTVLWSARPTEALRQTILEEAVETLWDLQSGACADWMDQLSASLRRSACDLELDFSESTWRSRLRAAITRSTEVEQAPPPPRRGPLDEVEAVLATNGDLRNDSGKLSATHVAAVFGVTITELGRWVCRSKQAIAKTPDADSLQPFLEHLERVARLRVATKGDGEFRKWLRTPNVSLSKRRPIDLLAAGHWQALADKVEDMLTGAPG